MIEVCKQCKQQNPGFVMVDESAVMCQACKGINTMEVIDDLASIVRDANECSDHEPDPPEAA